MVESGQKKIGREWPLKKRQRVATEKESESGQWKRGRDWLEEKKVERGQSKKANKD